MINPCNSHCVLQNRAQQQRSAVCVFRACIAWVYQNNILHLYSTCREYARTHLRRTSPGSCSERATDLTPNAPPARSNHSGGQQHSSPSNNRLLLFILIINPSCSSSPSSKYPLYTETTAVPANTTTAAAAARKERVR
jgi:hypothetical protein